MDYLESEDDDQARAKRDNELLERVLQARDDGALEPFLEERSKGELKVLGQHLTLLADLDELSGLLDEDPDAASDWSEAEPLAASDKLGRYEILGLIGEGGLSRVHLALDRKLGRRVALKVIKRQFSDPGEGALWLEREGRSLARLDHDGIVRVLDVGSANGHSFVAMEILEGPNLHDVLLALRSREQGGSGRQKEERESGHLANARRVALRLESIPERCRVVASLARALEYCHQKGVIHRDIKASNVLLDLEASPHLIDFGIAHLESEAGTSLHTQNLIGTPAYLAPEQIDQGRVGVSAASDLFSLGVVLYELLTLTQPFAREGTMKTLHAVARADWDASLLQEADIPVDLQRICGKCLMRDPGQRYPSMGHLAADLEAFLDHRAISLRAPTPLQSTLLWYARNRRQTLSVGGAVLVTLLLAVGAWGFQSWDARDTYLGRLSDRDQALAKCESEAEFRDVIALIEVEQWEARRLDSALIADHLFGAVSPEWERVTQDLKPTLLSVLEPELQAIEAAPNRFRRARLLESFRRAWETILHDAERLRGSPVLASIGRIELPEDGELFRCGSLFPENGIPVLTRVKDFGQAQLSNGLYRYNRRNGGRILETEFFVFADQVAWTPRLFAFLDRKAPPMLRIEPDAAKLEKEIVPKLQKQPSLPITPSALLLSQRVVNWGDLGRVFSADELWGVFARSRSPEPLPKELPHGDVVAAIPWADAYEYTVRLGGRLPTPLELYCALDNGDIEAGPAGAGEEWVSTPIPSDPRKCFTTQLRSLQSEDPIRWMRNVMSIDDSQGTIGFRVAISDPE